MRRWKESRLLCRCCPPRTGDLQTRLCAQATSRSYGAGHSSQETPAVQTALPERARRGPGVRPGSWVRISHAPRSPEPRRTALAQRLPRPVPPEAAAPVLTPQHSQAGALGAALQSPPLPRRFLRINWLDAVCSLLAGFRA